MKLTAAQKAALQKKNVCLGIALGIFAVALAASVFVWRFTHPLGAIPQAETSSSPVNLQPQPAQAGE